MATAHIRKRKSKDGIVSYQVIAEGECDSVTGKRNRHYQTARTRKEAEAIKRTMIADLEEGSVVKTSAMRLDTWMNKWLEEYLPNIEESTRVGYKEKIDGYINPKLGKYPLNALKPDQVQKWVNDLRKQDLSPKTIRNAYNNLNAALKKAVILRMITHNPCEGVELPKLVHYESQVYDADKIKEALEIAQGTDIYLLILLAASVGLRRGELAALKWEHVDFKAKMLHIRENLVRGDKKCVTKSPKTKAGTRDVSIGDEVIAALSNARMEYYRDKAELGKAFHDEGYIIRKKDGSPYHPDSITQKWERFTAKNGLPPVRLHDLRHSNATALIQAGVSPKVVQQRLGHSDINITLNTYTHVLPEMDQEAASTIDNLLFPTASNQ